MSVQLRLVPLLLLVHVLVLNDLHPVVRCQAKQHRVLMRPLHPLLPLAAAVVYYEDVLLPPRARLYLHSPLGHPPLLYLMQQQLKACYLEAASHHMELVLWRQYFHRQLLLDYYLPREWVLHLIQEV